MTMPLFADPTAAGQRPPVGEWTHIEKPTTPPFAPELAARAIASLGPEWEWHTVQAIYADESDRLTSPRVGTRIHFNVPKVGPKGGKTWPAMKTDRVLVVTEAQEREATERWEREHDACARCGGDGLVWNGSSATRGHLFITCARCGGSGKPQAVPA